MNKADVVNKLKELKPQLQKEYSIKKIGLFGSFANNTSNTKSDIDILVELDKPIGWKFLSLEIYLEKVFDRKIDITTKDALKKQIKEDILNSVTYID